MQQKAKYGDHLDTLISLTTQLAMSPSQLWSRSVRAIAESVSLPEDEVLDALSSFPGLFRATTIERDSQGRPMYALQARYALRSDSIGVPPELRSDLLSDLLEFIGRQAQQENADEQFRSQLEHSRRQFAEQAEQSRAQFAEQAKQDREHFMQQSRLTRFSIWVAAGAAIIAAVAGIVAAVVHW